MMFDDAPASMQTFISNLKYDPANPRIPVLPDSTIDSSSLVKLLPGGVKVGMPDVIPDYEGAAAIIDLFATQDLGFNPGRKMVDGQYPMIITILTRGIKSKAVLLNYKICGLILKAISHNRSLGLEDVEIDIPAEGTVRWGIMPQNRVSYKTSKNKYFSGQILIYINETDIL